MTRMRATTILRTLAWALALSAALLLSSCQKDGPEGPGPEPPSQPSVSTTDIIFSPEGESKSLTITSKNPPEVSLANDCTWAVLHAGLFRDYKITYAVAARENTFKADRRSKVSVYADGKRLEVTIRQGGTVED